GLPPALRPRRRRLPVDDELALAHARAAVVRGGRRGGLVAVPPRRRLPVGRGERGDALRLPAAAQGALAAVHAVAAAVLRSRAGAVVAGRRLPRRGPRDGHRDLPLVLPPACRP